MNRSLWSMAVLFFSLPLTAKTQEVLTDNSVKLYIGTFSVRGSEGIYVYNWNLETGQLEEVQIVPGRESPSFLSIHPNGQYLYAVQREGVVAGKDWGSIATYAIKPESGRLSFLDEQPSMGAGSCQVNTDAEGKLLFVSNYSEGNFTVYALGSDGKPEGKPFDFRYEGKGPNQSRQEKPHLHSAMPSPDNRFVFAADLGTDRLYAYRMKPKKGKLKAAKTA